MEEEPAAGAEADAEVKAEAGAEAKPAAVAEGGADGTAQEADEVGVLTIFRVYGLLTSRM